MKQNRSKNGFSHNSFVLWSWLDKSAFCCPTPLALDKSSDFPHKIPDIFLGLTAKSRVLITVLIK